MAVVALYLEAMSSSRAWRAQWAGLQPGSPTRRYQSLKIALEKLNAWREAPLLGVGPGGAIVVGMATAHTEFTRLLAEHGSSARCLLLLLVAAVRCVRKPKTVKGKPSRYV